jgi:hypothetical protein
LYNFGSGAKSFVSEVYRRIQCWEFVFVINDAQQCNFQNRTDKHFELLCDSVQMPTAYYLEEGKSIFYEKVGANNIILNSH